MSYVRASILGSSPGGETWSINPVFDPTFEFPGQPDQTLLDQACAAIAALTPGAQLVTNLSSAMAITGARLEVRDDSTDSLIAISTDVRATPLAGGSAPLRSAQDAMVFSLRTTTPGASGRGRLYWPAASGGIDANMRLTSAVVSSSLTQMATYLHAMEDALATAFPTIGFDLAVRSRRTHTTPHVNKLQLGNILDVQRRRRDKMIEDYTSVAF